MRNVHVLPWIMASTLSLLTIVGCSGTPPEESPTPTPVTPTATLPPGVTPTATLPAGGSPTPPQSPPPSPTVGPTETPGLTPTGTPGGPTPTAPAVTPTTTLPPEGTPTPTGTPLPNVDLDGDGFTVAEGDCNDSDKFINPDAVDVPYDGIDQDCADGDLIDVDEDGVAGIALQGQDEVDCDDNDDTVYPGAAEVCDSKDQNCNNQTDEGVLIIGYRDNDGDGYGVSNAISSACTLPSGYATLSGDCIDSDASVNPGATEVCDNKDNDCDSLTDDADPSVTSVPTWYRDNDTDGYGDKNSTKTGCLQPSGYVSNSTDCNDTDKAINPGATEFCDGKDNDCDTLIDDADSSVSGRSTWYKDGDGDGYGDASVVIQTCSRPNGFVSNANDCNDNNKYVNPAATEICDGVDNNCNGVTDEGVTATTYYRDADGDGFGDPAVSTTTCNVPSGYVPMSGDCQDSNKNVYPGALEVCNGIDDDCDKSSDEEGAVDSCPDTGSECTVKTCTGGTCSVAFVTAGTKTTSQTPNDCQANVCDGSGGITTQAENTDLPVDTNQCTQGACTQGVPSQLPEALGTACNSDGGVMCNAKSACLPAFVALKLGTGSAALSSAATAVFLEYRLSDGSLVPNITNPLPLPTAASGSNQPVTLAGTKTAEGALTSSADGHYVVMAGYAAAPGTASVAGTTASTVNRVGALISASQAINSSTLLNSAYNGDSVRGAASVDGSALWFAGTSAGTPESAGIQYAVTGTTGSTQISATPNNMRTVGIVAGQLYATSATTGGYGLSTVGTGLPTTAGQTVVQLPGMPTTSGVSPYGFVLMDRDSGVAGVDTLYMADDRAPTSGGGIQKWTFNGTTWSLQTTFNTGLTTGVRGLAGVVTGNAVTLFGSTADTSGNKLISLVDDGTTAPAITILTTAGTNTLYRGVTIAPK